jgi:aspartokinase/homoserine dehydrogenase 1
MQRKLKIMKFGGAAIKNNTSLFKARKILMHFSNEKIICVISAFGKTTSILKKASQFARNKELNKANDEISNMHSFYKEIYKDDKEIEDEIYILFDDLRGLLKGISITGELTNKTLDKFLSFGEKIASKIFRSYLINNNINAILTDSSELITTDSNFGNAKPDTESTYRLIKEKIPKKFENNNLIIIPGFTAADKNGSRTTMGMESSNLTAILLADALEIREITFWTDVEGIRSFDPKIINKTLPVSYLSYQQAKIAAYSGLKLIYPDMIDFSRKRDVTIIYKSLENPNSDSTIISRQKGNIPVLIVDSYYSNINGIETQYNMRKITTASGKLFCKTNNEEAKYSLITVVTDNFRLKKALLMYLHKNTIYEKLESENDSISVLLKKEYVIKPTVHIHKMLTSFFGRDSLD